jgi:threonyl-tRNA synthetase
MKKITNSLSKDKMEHLEKKYYVLNTSFEVVPVDAYGFAKSETHLKSLLDDERLPRNPKLENEKVKAIIENMGFSWEPMSELGHMRQMPYAVSIMEAIEKYAWLAVERFGNEQDFPIYRISGGELFDPNNPELREQLSIISKNPGLFGSNQYRVIIDNKEQILRYSACTQKFSVAKGINIFSNDLPFGLFEVSKSYRFEEERALQLCKRVRSFHIPELDIINDSLTSSLKMALAAHREVLGGINKLDPEYELLCSVSNDFFKKNLDFLKTIVKSINKPILLAVYEDVQCKDGVKIDIEYKVFDSLKCPLEIATVLVDDGSTKFSCDVKFQTESGVKKPISTLHIVFPFASIERFAYFLLDRAIKKETESGFSQLPFWAAPIQARIIARDGSCLKDAKELANELSSLNFRVDLDDRKINYDAKNKAEDLKWIPYVITIDKNNDGLQNLSVENKTKCIFGEIMRKDDLVKKMNTEEDKNIVVPRYLPMLLSKRELFNNKRGLVRKLD